MGVCCGDRGQLPSLEWRWMAAMPGSCHESCANSGGKGQPVQPLTGGRVGSPSHLLNKATQGWLLTPNHFYYMPLSVRCHSPRIPPRLCYLQEALPDHAGTELLHCRPSGLSPSLVFTRMLCILWLHLDHSDRPDVPRGYGSNPTSAPPLPHT